MTDPQVIVNLGTGGSDLNGQNGSTSSADSNDARFLDWPGDNAGNYVYLPGVAGNYLSVPDEAALDITGDIDLRVRLAMDDWTPATATALLSKYTTTGNFSFMFRLETDGDLRLYWSTDGTAVTNKRSTVGVSAAGGDVLWVRVILDVDNGSSGHDVKFYTSLDGSSFSQLGATVTTAGTTSIYASTTDVELGSRNSGATDAAAGKFYRAQILDGIDGTTVLDVDTSVITSGSATSFTDLTGNHTVSINRSTSGRKSVAVVSPVWLFGTDDFMEVADNALLDFGASDSFTVLAVVRLWATPANFGHYVGKRNAANEGYLLRTNFTNLQPRSEIEDIASNNVVIQGSTFTAGLINIIGFTVDRTVEEMKSFTNDSLSAATGTSAIGNMSNSINLVLGRRPDAGGGFQDFEFLSAAVFRRALSASEIAAITTYFQNRVA